MLMKSVSTLFASLIMPAGIITASNAVSQSETLAANTDVLDRQKLCKTMIDLGEKAYDSNKPRKALQYLDEALELCDPTDSLSILYAHNIKSLAYKKLNDYDNWLSEKNTISVTYGAYVDLDDLAADYAYFGKLKESDEVLAKYYEEWGGSLSYYTQAAKNHMARGDYQAALDLLIYPHNLYPTREVYDLSFECFMKKGDYFNAANAIIYTNDSFSWNFTGDQYQRLVEAIPQAIDCDIDRIYVQAVVAKWAEDYDKADELLRSIDYSDKDAKPFRICLPQMYMNLGDLDKTIVEFESYRDDVGSFAWGMDYISRTNLAIHYYYNCQYDEALDLLYSLPVTYHLDLAYCYMGKRQWENALSTLEKGVETANFKSIDEMKLYLADMYHLLGNDDRANELYHEVIEADEFAEAGLATEMAYASIGEKDKALSLLQLRYDDKKNFKGLYNLYEGCVYLRLGDKSNALKCLEKALSNGFYCPGLIMTNPDYAKIENDSEFRSIMNKYFPHNDNMFKH